MLVAYYSKTGNVRRFVNKLDMRSIDVEDVPKVDEDFILITPTYGFGQVPDKVLEFLDINNKLLKGVMSSGNMNWGDNYGKSADIISKRYNVPIIHKIELSGVEVDVSKFKERVRELYGEVD